MRLFILLVCVYTTGFCQNYEQISRLALFHNQKLDSLLTFMENPPSAVQEISGLKQVVYELESFSIGVSADAKYDNRIHEIYIFQTGLQNGHDYWNDIFKNLIVDPSLKFTKGIFNDGTVKENNLPFNSFVAVLENASRNNTVNYAVRFKREEAYLTAAVLNNKMVVTIDDKNH